jgi:hypothetical protein
LAFGSRGVVVVPFSSVDEVAGWEAALLELSELAALAEAVVVPDC